MDFFIFTIGEASLLRHILNAVAAIFGGSGQNPTLNIVLKIAWTLGFIGVMIRSMMGGTRTIDFGPSIIGLGLVAVLFFPKADVTIQDVYTSQTYSVANVPLGIAAVGSVSSRIGLYIAEVYDQGFSLPNSGQGITQNGYISGINSLLSVRKVFSQPSNWAHLDNAGGGNYFDSWSNYVQDCTLVGLDTGVLDMNNILTSNNLAAAIKFDAVVYVTQINVSGTPQTATCSAAHTLLMSYNGSAHASIYKALIPSLYGNNAPAGLTSANIEAKVGDAMTYLGESYASNSTYLSNTLLLPVFVEAMKAKSFNDQDATSQVMLNQAIEQRNMQWAADYDIFKSTFRPLYAFIEMIIYACTPIMAIMLMFGSIGIGTVTKQLVGLIWIQLWLPLMSVSNMFIYLAAAGELAGLKQSVGADLTSIAAIMQFEQVLRTWVATGSYMASSAPVLAGFLLYGSAVSLQGLASKMEGMDHVNEKIAQPDAIAPAPHMAMQSALTTSHLNGTYATDAPSRLADITIQNALNAQRTQALSDMESFSQGHDQNIQRAYGQLKTDVTDYKRMAQFGQTAQASWSEGYGTMTQITDQVTKGMNLTDQQTESVRGAIGAAMSIGGSAGFDGLGNGIKAGLKANGTMTDEEVNQKTKQIVEQFHNQMQSQSNAKAANEFRDQFSAQMNDTRSDGFADQYFKRDNMSFTQTYSHKAAAEERYTKLNAASEGVSATKGGNIGLATIMANSGGYDQVKSIIDGDEDLTAAFNRNVNKYSNEIHSDDKLKSYAALMTMQGAGRIAEIAPQLAHAAGINLENIAKPRNLVDDGDLLRDKGEQVRRNTHNETHHPGGAEGVWDGAQIQLAEGQQLANDVNSSTQNGLANVNQMDNVFNARTRSVAQDNADATKAQRVTDAENNLLNSSNSPSKAMYLSGVADRPIGGVLSEGIAGLAAFGAANTKMLDNINKAASGADNPDAGFVANSWNKFMAGLSAIDTNQTMADTQQYFSNLLQANWDETVAYGTDALGLTPEQAQVYAAGTQQGLFGDTISGIMNVVDALPVYADRTGSFRYEKNAARDQFIGDASEMTEREMEVKQQEFEMLWNSGENPAQARSFLAPVVGLNQARDSGRIVE